MLKSILLVTLCISFVLSQAPAPAPAPAAGAAPPTGDWTAFAEIPKDKIKDKESLMKLLRNGDKDNLDLIYIIAMKDSTRTDQETKDATQTMEVGLQTLKLKDMGAAQPAPAGGAAPAPAATPAPAPAPAPAGGAAAPKPATPAPAGGAAPAAGTTTTAVAPNPDQHKSRVQEY